jgi:hypothetical protein
MAADLEPALWKQCWSEGRRIEVKRDFDAETLARLIRRAERSPPSDKLKKSSMRTRNAKSPYFTRKMKTSLLIVFGVLGAMAALAKAESAVTAFDGTWAVTLNGHEYKDPNTGQTAQAYVYHFNAQVKNGLLYGERGTKGSPGWLELKGKIEADGTAHLHANTLTGPGGSRGQPLTYDLSIGVNRDIATSWNWFAGALHQALAGGDYLEKFASLVVATKWK